MTVTFEEPYRGTVLVIPEVYAIDDRDKLSVRLLLGLNFFIVGALWFLAFFFLGSGLA